MTAPDEAASAGVVRAAPPTQVRAASVAAVIALVTRGRNVRTALLLRDMGQLGNSCSAQCRVHASEQNGNKMNKKRQFMTSRLLLASAPPVRG